MKSVWYKLSDRTRAGGTIAFIGAVITLVLLYLLVPRMGYMGAAWTTLACYGSMAIISYIWGQKHYPVPYNLPRILGYMALGILLWWGCELITIPNLWLKYGFRSLVLLGYLGLAWKLEGLKFPTRS